MAFYICTLLTYWSGWLIVSKLIVALSVGLIVLLLHRYLIDRDKKTDLHWRTSLWIWPYLSGITLISYWGNFGGGKGDIPFGWDFACIGALCLAVMWMALKFKLPAIQTQAYIDQLELTHPPTQ